MSVSIMKKLTVLCPVSGTDLLVRKLMRLRCIQLRTVPVGVPPDEAGAAPEATPAAETATASITGEQSAWLRLNCDRARAEAERRVKDVEDALAVLNRYATKAKPLRRPTGGAFSGTGSYESAWEAVRDTLQLRDAIHMYRAEETKMTNRCASLQPWLAYDAPLEAGSSGTDRWAIWLGALPAQTAFESIVEALRGVDAGAEEISRDRSGCYIAVCFLREDEELVNRALSPLGFLRCDFAAAGVTGLAAEAERVAAQTACQMQDQISVCMAKLHDLSAFVPDVERLYDMEMTTLIAAREKQKLAATKACVLLEGWVPAQRESRVSAVLEKLECAWEMQDPVEGEEEPPILLKNNGYASNFEWVVGMYAYPKYGTYDPTFIMSLFYFVIFGMMFADVGYGLLLLLVGFLAPKLLHLKPGLTRMLNMFGYCGISCVLLGIVFGGWFGDMPYAIMVNMMQRYDTVAAAKEAVPFFNGLVVTLGGSPVSLNPLEEPMAFLVISLLMGAVHLVAGMAVKFVLLCKEGKVADAIFDIGSWWLLFLGLGLLVTLKNPVIGGVVLGVGVLLIVLFGGRAQKNPVLRILMGVKGLYDIVSYASDLLSYCRILALGLAAGVIAQVVNLIATMGGPSVGGFVVMILAFLLGHALNMAINLLGAFVHTSRLQYLEFFNKFFVDGGEAFEPMLPSEKYTVDATDVDSADAVDAADATGVTVGAAAESDKA